MALRTAQRSAGGEASGRPSIVDPLVERLRALAEAPDFHARAWEAMRGPCDELLEQDAAFLELELARLEEHYQDGRESDLVHSACLVVMGRLAPRPWFEERFPVAPEGSPETERAYWIALAGRRTGSFGLPIALSGFRSWTKLETYPLTVDRLASQGEVAEAADRLRVPLPPETYETDARTLPEVRQENFTREVVVLAVFGPGAARDSQERRRLFSWMEPRSMEEAILTPPAGFALGLAAHVSDEIAHRLLGLAENAPRAADRRRILEYLARQGGRADLVVGPLAELLREATNDASGEANRIIATDLLNDLLQSDDPRIREDAFIVAFDEFLDPDNSSVLRRMLLSLLTISGQGDFAAAVSLVLETEQDPEMLKYLSVNLREIGDGDPALALDLFSQLLSRDTLSVDDKKFALRQIKRMGGQEALDLLGSFAARDSSEEVRAYARQLLGA